MVVQRTYILTYIHAYIDTCCMCYVQIYGWMDVHGMYVCMYLRTYISAARCHTNSETSARLTRPSTKVSPERRQKKGRESCRGQCSPHVSVCCCCSRALLLASKRWNGPLAPICHAMPSPPYGCWFQHQHQHKHSIWIRASAGGQGGATADGFFQRPSPTPAATTSLGRRQGGMAALSHGLASSDCGGSLRKRRVDQQQAHAANAGGPRWLSPSLSLDTSNCCSR